MKNLLLFPVFYLKEVVVGTLLVARDVIVPEPKLAPILLHVPVSDLSSGQRLLLACLVSMTPGTITIEECERDGSFLVHSLYGARDPQGTIDHLKKHYEPFVRRIPV